MRLYQRLLIAEKKKATLVFISVQTKKQQWAASLCHSLVPHTNVDL